MRNLIAETPFSAAERLVKWDGLNDHVPVWVHALPVFRLNGGLALPGRYVARGIVLKPVQLQDDVALCTVGQVVQPYGPRGRDNGGPRLLAWGKHVLLALQQNDEIVALNREMGPLL